MFMGRYNIFLIIIVGFLSGTCTLRDSPNELDGSVPDDPFPGEGGCIDDDGGSTPDPMDGGIGPGSCPADMVWIPANPARGVGEPFCIDIYEASYDNASAVSLPGVAPWQVADNAAAQAACVAAGKTLCSANQWYVACIGPEETVYAYGNGYEPTTCNGLDTYCYCDAAPCTTADPCPYPGCYFTCGADFHWDLTGASSGCTNGYGVIDMNGNVWEHVLGGNDTTVRGGAYNCGDSETYHRCDYIPGTWTPSARGFRCCK